MIVELSPYPPEFQIGHFTFHETNDNVLFKKKQWRLPT